MMKRPPELLRDAVTATRERRKAVTSQSERNIMLSTILIASAISVVTAYVLTQCYSVDVLSSLLYTPQDCWGDWGTNIGRHCFSDYTVVVTAGLEPNPWKYPFFLPPNYQPTTVAYPAAGWIPQLVFGLPAHWLGVPRLGLIGYLAALTMAVLTPAIWASRGSRGFERVVIFVILGAAAIPAWAVIDRGNSAGFLAPIALVFLIALVRQKWAVVVVMVILAAMIKPQFAVLAVVLLAARKYKLTAVTVAGIGISNLAAYLLWPRDFPGTITKSISDILVYNRTFGGLLDARNVSFGRALLLIPDSIKSGQTGKVPDDFLSGPRTSIGYVAVIIVSVVIVALGKRIPAVMAGIALLATATLFPAYTSFYYLIFALPVGALMVRNPSGNSNAGLFDDFSSRGDPRRSVGIAVGLATALSIAQIAIPKPPVPVQIFGQLGNRGVVGTTLTVPTTVSYSGMLWLIACAIILISYARKPCRCADNSNSLYTAEADSAVATEKASEAS